MYNEDIKNRFMWDISWQIGRSGQTYKAFKQLFIASEPLEREKGRDLAELYSSQMAALDEIEAVRSIPPMRYRACLLRYMEWYKNQYPDASVEYGLSWVLDSLQRYKSSIVVNPTQLQIELDKLFGSEDEATMDAVYRCYLWIAYAGVASKVDAFALTPLDVNLPELCFTLDGCKYPIYQPAIQSFAAAAYRTELLYEHPNYTTMRRRIPGDKLLRGFKGDAEGDWISRKIRERIGIRQANGIDCKCITYSSLLHSGWFYRQHELEMAGADVDFSHVVKPVSFRKELSPTALYGKKMRVNAELKDEYYVWKYLFYKGVV